MALMLQLRTRIKPKPPIRSYPYLTHPFSTSNSGDGDPDPPNPKSPFSSLFNDVKEQLKQKQSTTSQLRKTTPFSFSSTNPQSSSNSRPSELGSLEEIRKNLSEFRRRASSPDDGGEPSAAPVSFQEIYHRNVTEKPLNTSRGTDGKNSWEAIRQSIKKIQSNKQPGGLMTLPEFRNVLNSKTSGPSDAGGSSVIGGTSELPAGIFARELNGRKEPVASPTEFVKMYGYEELGEKLRKLRMDGEGKEGFSIKELNERLRRLREMEEKESLLSTKGIVFNDLRESLVRLQNSADEEKGKNFSMQRFIMGHLHSGKTPDVMLGPPKEHLIEKFYHPDNMSSEEKLKIELAKVRDEFKMSESDCGSARVQVAQLTTKIKHLSSVLHKKDKHSRKGLQAMVQRRKRLLKYLRRSDWDSYCFTISKLGLRDNADVKA